MLFRKNLMDEHETMNQRSDFTNTIGGVKFFPLGVCTPRPFVFTPFWGGGVQVLIRGIRPPETPP